MSNLERYIERQLGEITAELDQLRGENKQLKADRDRLYATLQSIAGYRSHRVGTEAWGLAAHYCQAVAREALAAHKGGITT